MESVDSEGQAFNDPSLPISATDAGPGFSAQTPDLWRLLLSFFCRPHVRTPTAGAAAETCLEARGHWLPLGCPQNLV